MTKVSFLNLIQEQLDALEATICEGGLDYILSIPEIEDKIVSSLLMDPTQYCVWAISPDELVDYAHETGHISKDALECYYIDRIFNV